MIFFMPIICIAQKVIILLRPLREMTRRKQKKLVRNMPLQMRLNSYLTDSNFRNNLYGDVGEWLKPPVC